MFLGGSSARQPKIFDCANHLKVIPVPVGAGFSHSKKGTTMAAAAKKTTPTKAEVIKNEVTDEEFVDTVETIDTPESDNTPAVKTETIEIAVTLANGAEITLEVIKDQNDWDYAAVEAMHEMNYPVLMNAILTRSSKLKLKMTGAKVRDFEMITDKVTGALNSIKDEYDAKKKK